MEDILQALMLSIFVISQYAGIYNVYYDFFFDLDVTQNYMS